MDKYPKTCVIFSETYLPLFGGAEMYTFNFAKQLALRGTQVVIATYTTGEIPPEYRIPGVSVIHLPKLRKSEALQAPELIGRVRRLIVESEYVCANYTYALGAMTALFARMGGKRSTLFAHGFGTIIDRTHPRIYTLYRWIALRCASHVITTSEEIADIVRKYSPHVLVATAVDFEWIDACLARAGYVEHPIGTKRVLTIRRLVEKNGIQYLIEAVPYLLRLRQDFHCTLVGEGRLRRELEERVQELGISGYVSFEGSIENNRVFSYIKSADVVVFPSSAEALSLAAIECMYIGTPVLASDVGGLRELLGTDESRGTLVDLFGRTESVYEAPDPATIPAQVYEEFARKISMVLDKDAKIQERQTQAKRFAAERYDWKSVAERILDFSA